uniref:Variant surface glycoprotein 1125.2718 n=1 Tax=Trypanosoma brucei TaxID=5691 RepID=A0A1J0R8Q6_9TRYP|nr:variant surface glycoprotein 1125.2718 [Trypanosoma brucei]
MQATMSAVAPGVILAIAALKQARGVTDGDNAAIFKPLCAALQLADVKPTFEPPIQPKMPEALDMYRLNMSIAPKDWRANFLNQGNKAASTPAEVPTDEKDEELKARWKTWADTAVFLATEDNEKELKANYGLTTTTDAQVEAIRPTIHDIVEAAHDIYTQTQNTGQNTPADDNLLQKEIAEAVYGEQAWAATTLTAQSFKRPRHRLHSSLRRKRNTETSKHSSRYNNLRLRMRQHTNPQTVPQKTDGGNGMAREQYTGQKQLGQPTHHLPEGNQNKDNSTWIKGTRRRSKNNSEHTRQRCFRRLRGRKHLRRKCKRSLRQNHRRRSIRKPKRRRHTMYKQARSRRRQTRRTRQLQQRTPTQSSSN